jgi:hypothetical protein
MGYLGYKPADKPLTAADITDSIITSAKIVDGTIANADINSSAAISLSKLSTTGTADATTFLRGDGAYTAVSSDFVKLATTAITANTATVSFDGYFSATYKNYIFIGSNLKNDADGHLRMRYRQSNADVTSADYLWSQKTNRVTSGAIVDDSNGDTESFFRLNGTNTVAAARVMNFQFYLFEPLNTSYHKYYLGSSNHLFSVPPEYFYFHNIGGLFKGNTTALSGVTFYMSSGNLDDGSISLYGIKH